MDVRVTWSSGMSFAGSAPSGFIVPLGTDLGSGGADDGFRPIELLAISLAGCGAMDVMSILRKKQQHVSSFDVQFHGTRHGEHPKVITAAQVVFRVSGTDVSEAAVRRAIELSVTKYCPAYAMLTKAFPIETSYEIYRDTSDGAKELLAEGNYSPVEAPQ